jgi:hypothetical protein
VSELVCLHQAHYLSPHRFRRFLGERVQFVPTLKVGLNDISLRCYWDFFYCPPKILLQVWNLALISNVSPGEPSRSKFFNVGFLACRGFLSGVVLARFCPLGFPRVILKNPSSAPRPDLLLTSLVFSVWDSAEFLILTDILGTLTWAATLEISEISFSMIFSIPCRPCSCFLTSFIVRSSLFIEFSISLPNTLFSLVN